MTTVIPRDNPRAASADRAPLIDPFGRTIDYVRVSVTDRCDLRCTYCMAERQTFLPRAELLTIEELDRLCSTFVDLGTTRLRLTGGEPLIRKGFMDLVAGLSRHLDSGRLKELTLTTNGTQLERHAEALARYGVRRINVSIDTLDPEAYRQITRGGDLAAVLRGLEAAQAAGLEIKINVVALKADNATDLPDMIAWAHGRGMGMTSFMVLLRVELPMAWPVILTGMRVSGQMVMGVAAIAAWVLGPGLGGFIFSGLSRLGGANALASVLTGVIAVIVVAFILDLLLALLGRLTTSRGLRV